MDRRSQSWTGLNPVDTCGWLLTGALAGGASMLLVLALATRPVHGIALLVALLILLLTTRHLFASLIVILSVVIVLGSDSLFSIDVGFHLVEVDALLLIAMFGATIHALSHPSGLELRPLDFPILIFGWAMAVSVIVGFLNGWPPDIIRNELRPIGFLIGSYLIARQSLKEVGQLRTLMLIILAATLLASLRTIYVYVTTPLMQVADPAIIPGAGGEGFRLGNRVMNSDGFKRVIGFGGEVFPVIVFIGVMANLGTVRSRLQRVGLGLAMPVLLAVIVISFTRSYWVGTMAGLAAYALAPPRRYRRWVWGYLAIVLIAGVVVVSQIGAMQGIDAFGLLADRAAIWRHIGGDASIQSRLFEAKAILSSFKESPILGRGLGGEFVYYSPFGGGSYQTSDYTHNSYMSVLLKSGMLGLLALLYLLLAGLRHSWHIHRRVADGELRQLGFVFSSSLLVVAIVSLTSPWLTHFVGGSLAGVSLAVLMFIKEQGASDTVTETDGGGPAARAGLSAGGKVGAPTRLAATATTTATRMVNPIGPDGPLESCPRKP